jgi:hypothetical protein
VHNSPAVLSALVDLMPGEWPDTYPSGLSNFVPRIEHDLAAVKGSWPDTCATQAEVESLLQVLDREVFLECLTHGLTAQSFNVRWDSVASQ